LRSPQGWILLELGAAGFALGASAEPLPYSATLMLEVGSFASLTASAGGTIEVADDGSFTLPASVLQEQDPVTGILSITFTPEPARLALETASIGALALLGALRLRRRAAE